MRSTIVAVALGLALATAPAAAQRSHIGLHGGYNFDFEDPLIGAQVLLPVSRAIELYPSFDYYFPDAGGLVGFNADLKFNLRGGWTFFYVGGGINVLKPEGGSAQVGPDLFLGLDTRLGASHPYLEVRWLLQDRSSVQLVGGLNFTLF